MSDYHDWNRPRPDDEDGKEAEEEQAPDAEVAQDRVDIIGPQPSQGNFLVRP